MIIDARDLFLAVRELVEMGRQSRVEEECEAVETEVIDMRSVFVALRRGVPMSALQAQIRLAKAQHRY